MSHIIETQRLILRPWRDEDITAFASINADPMVMEYFPRRLSEKDTSKLVARFRALWAQNGHGPFALEIKKTGAFIGFAGLLPVDANLPFAPATEIAWRLDYEAWGKGYATEAGLAVLQQGFEALGLQNIVGYAVHDNEGAIHVMEKMGMQRDMKGDFHYPRLDKNNRLGQFRLYTLSKQDFFAKAS